MKGKIYNTLMHVAALMACFMVAGSSASAVDISVQPGNLASELKTNPVTDGSLKLTGSVDVRDLMAVADIPGLKSLDLGDAQIVEYQTIRSVYMNMSVFKANVLPQYMFMGSELEEVVLPSTLQAIGEGTFAVSKLKSLTVPMRLTTIGDYAFRDCTDLEDVTFNTQLKTIGKSAFAGCEKLQSINMTSTQVKVLPEQCFAGDVALKEITLPVDLKRIGTRALSGTSISELSVPDGTLLDDFALADMTKLRTLEGAVEARGVGAFYNDTVLRSVDKVPTDFPDLLFANCHVLNIEDQNSGIRTMGRMSLADTCTGIITFGPDFYYMGSQALSGVTPYLGAIDARAVGDNIPVVEDDTFEGMDPAMVKLCVTPESVEQWENHPQWGKFAVVTDITSVGSVADDVMMGIRVKLEDKTLKVASPVTIEDVKIYDAAGAPLAMATPNATDFALSLADLPSQRVIMVVLRGGAKQHVVKIMN